MDAELLRAGEGEVVSDKDERTVLVKVGTDELAMTWSRYEAGESGPGPHVHHRHVDAFYVLDGELLFEVGGERVEAGPGTFALVPPDVVHTFRNESAASARFLNFHAPSCGFHDHLMGRLDDFDQHDPPDDGGRPFSEALVVPPGPAVKSDSGPLGVREVSLAPGQSAAGAERALWVIDGVVAVDGVEAGPGDLVRSSSPASNRGDVSVVMLEIAAPA